MVAERVKTFEKSANSDEEKSPNNSLSEEVGGAREDDNNEGRVVEVWQQAVSSSSSSAGGGMGEKVWSTDEQTIVQIASQNVRQIWDERTKGIRCTWLFECYIILFKGNKTNIEEKDSSEVSVCVLYNFSELVEQPIYIMKSTSRSLPTKLDKQ